LVKSRKKYIIAGFWSFGSILALPFRWSGRKA
jgi:hypothetical protein